MTDSDFLTAYRHSKALTIALEHILRDRGIIKCPQCGVGHKMGEPHMAKPQGFSALLNRVEVSG